MSVPSQNVEAANTVGKPERVSSSGKNLSNPAPVVPSRDIVRLMLATPILIQDITRGV